MSQAAGQRATVREQIHVPKIKQCVIASQAIDNGTRTIVAKFVERKTAGGLVHLKLRKVQCRISYMAEEIERGRVREHYIYIYIYIYVHVCEIRRVAGYYYHTLHTKGVRWEGGGGPPGSQCLCTIRHLHVLKNSESLVGLQTLCKMACPDITNLVFSNALH